MFIEPDLFKLTPLFAIVFLLCLVGIILFSSKRQRRVLWQHRFEVVLMYALCILIFSFLSGFALERIQMHQGHAPYWYLRAELAVNRWKWRRLGAEEYSYSIEVTSVGLDGFTDRAQLHISKDQGFIMSPPTDIDDIDTEFGHWNAYDRVEDQFSLVEKLINEKTDTLIVQYHPMYGFPQKLYYDMDKSVEYGEVWFESDDMFFSLN